MVLLYLLLMTQKCTFRLLLCQKKIIKILLSNKIKDFKDLFTGMNIKEKKKNETVNGDNPATIVRDITLDPSVQGVNRLFAMAYSSEDGQPNRNSQQNYYLPRIDLKKI